MKRIATLTCLVVLLVLLAGCNFPTQNAGILNGKVVENGKDTPIANAQVVLQGAGNYTATTDANGNFHFNSIKTGSYTLTVTHADYTTATQSVTVSQNTSDIVVKMQKTNQTTGTLTGLVKIKDSSTAIANATVAIKDTTLTATTDANGNFSFANLAYGTYTLNVSKDGFVGTSKDVEVNQASINVEIFMEKNTTQEDICHVTGTMKVKGSSTVIPGVSIVFNSETAISGLDGNFSIDLPYGTYTVTASKEGFETIQQSVTLNSATQTINMEMSEQTKPVSVETAKDLVKDFKTSLYHLGTTYLSEKNLIEAQYLETLKFYEGIYPYLNEVGFALQHLNAMEMEPGTYTFVRFDADGWPLYELETPQDADSATWKWVIEDSIYGFNVSMSIPNASKHIVTSLDGSTITADFTNCDVICAVKSDSNPEAVYNFTLHINDTNVTTYSYTYEEEYYNGSEEVTKQITVNVKVPSGPTATILATIDPHKAEVGKIVLDSKFNIESLTDGKQLALDGTLTTPAFTYKGELKLKVENLTDNNLNINQPYPLVLTANGTLTNPTYTLSAGCTLHFEPIITEGPVLDKATITGSYVTAQTSFEGCVDYVFVNVKTYDFEEMDSPTNYPVMTFAFDGTVENGTKSYAVDLELTMPTMDSVNVDMHMATPYFSLEGALVYTSEDGFIKADVNSTTGLTLNFKLPAIAANQIGTIINTANGDQLAVLKLDDTFGQTNLLIVYKDGSSEIVPLNPAAYLPATPAKAQVKSGKVASKTAKH